MVTAALRSLSIPIGDVNSERFEDEAFFSRVPMTLKNSHERLGTYRTIFNRIQSFPTLGVLRDLIQVWYRVDVVDVKQEREGNKATAKYVAWPICACLLLSFFLFPVRHALHPLCTISPNRRPNIIKSIQMCTCEIFNNSPQKTHEV